MFKNFQNSIQNFWIITRFYYKSGNEHFIDEALQASSSNFILLAVMVVFQFTGSLSNEIITYLICGNLLYVATNPRIDWILGNIIKDKKLPNYTLLPTNIYTHFIAHGLANSWFGLLVSSISLVPILLLFIDKIDLNGLTIFNILIFVLVAVLGLLLRVALQMIIGFTTFLTKEVAGSVAIYINLELFLAGTLFPISILASILPVSLTWFKDFLILQPLAFIVYHPTQIILGNYNFSNVILTLIGVFVWTILIWILNISSLKLLKKQGYLD